MNYKQCVKNKIFKKSGIYKNKKTGKEYHVLFTAINCTNAQDGQETGEIKSWKEGKKERRYSN